MKRVIGSVLLGMFVHAVSAQSTTREDSLSLRTVVIEASRATERTPVTFTELRSRDISALNNGQDMPMLLRYTPSLLSTSDAGNGFGYTGLWIRGSDPSRINITINGIPINDPESQQVFWVNMPDLASSADRIQIQRGVGTSTNGAASFGGTIRVETFAAEYSPYVRTQQTAGSFRSLRSNLQFGTGLVAGRVILEGRLSRALSDGFIDRASSDLRSWFASATIPGERSNLVLTAFGGREVTYQSWFGTPAGKLEGATDEELEAFAARNEWSEDELQNLLSSGRTYNYYTYENQVDNYGQDHAQLHYRTYLSDQLNLNLALHYTRGRGFFEEYRAGESLEEYGFYDTLQTDLVRRRWLDNHFYGVVGSVNYSKGSHQLVLGFGANEYVGDHFGHLIWASAGNLETTDQEYYRGESTKRDGHVYLRDSWTIRERWDLYGDLQLRMVDYVTAGVDNDLRVYDVDDALVFFNPKLGVNFRPNALVRYYFSIGAGSKEPNRNDYVDAPAGTVPRPERMVDIEAGFHREWTGVRIAVNVYAMEYTDQLVLTGALNDVGAPLRTNVPVSFRRGVEAEFGFNPHPSLMLGGNVTWSVNRIREFEEVLYDYTNSWDGEVVVNRYTNTPISFSPDVIASYIGEWTFGVKKTEEKSRSYALAILGKYAGRQYLDNTGSDDRVLDAYLVHDVRLTYRYSGPRIAGIELNAWVNNVLNTEYSSNGYTYGYIYQERISERFYYPQAGIHFLVGCNLYLR